MSDALASNKHSHKSRERPSALACLDVEADDEQHIIVRHKLMSSHAAAASHQLRRKSNLLRLRPFPPAVKVKEVQYCDSDAVTSSLLSQWRACILLEMPSIRCVTTGKMSSCVSSCIQVQKRHPRPRVTALPPLAKYSPDLLAGISILSPPSPG